MLKSESASHSVVSDSLWPPRTVACQPALSLGFYWNGLPCPPPEESSRPRNWIQVSHIAGKFFTIWATRKAHVPCWHPLSVQICPNYFAWSSFHNGLLCSVFLPGIWPYGECLLLLYPLVMDIELSEFSACLLAYDLPGIGNRLRFKADSQY